MLKYKLSELTILLQLDLKNVDILCFTEHWLKEEHTGLINIDNFKSEVVLVESVVNMVVHVYM
jgi:hypothetical protein